MDEETGNIEIRFVLNMDIITASQAEFFQEDFSSALVEFVDSWIDS